MMSRSPSRTLKLTYLGDASQLSNTTKGAASDVSSLGDRVKTVGKTLAVGFAAVGAAGFAMGRQLFNAFEEVSTANARVEQVVTSMGNFEGQVSEVTDRLIAQAEATARLTGVDRTLIKESQALLLTFDSVNQTADQAGGIFDRATDAAIDLAAAGFGSATSNAQSLGRALEDPIAGLTSLTRQGVTFTEEQQNLIRSLVESNQTLEAQDVILSAIERQVGGVAEATANGSDKMRQSFGILRDQIATALAPAFERLVEHGLAFTERVGEWWEENGPDVIERFKEFGESVKESWEELKEFGAAIRDDILDRGTLTELTDQVRTLRDRFRETRDSFNRLRTAFSSGETATAVSIIGAHFDFIAGRVSKLIDALDRVLTFVNNVLDRLARLGEFFQGRGQLSIPGGDFNIPDDFVPGQIAPGSPFQPASTTNITVNGAIDPEGTARTIQRVLGDARLRGTVTTGAFV